MLDAENNIINAETKADFPAKKESKFLAFVKNLFIFFLLVGVIAGSFWVSYLLGKRILVPVKKLPERKIELVMPEAPPSIAALQEFKKEKAEKPREPVVPAPARVEQAEKQNYYKVQAGLYVNKSGALDLAKKLNENGFHTYLKRISEGWRVQVGAFFKKTEALGLQRLLSSKGFSSSVIYE